MMAVGGACRGKLPAFAADARYTSCTAYRIDDKVKQTTDHRPQTTTLDHCHHRQLVGPCALSLSLSFCLSIPFSLFYPLPLPCA